ncbi:MAG: DUF6785 family protein [bacterium]
MKPDDTQPAALSVPRYLFAVAVGLLGAAFSWVGTPYIDLFINWNPYAIDMSDGYLPLGAMGFLLLVVLGLNPLLRRFLPRCALGPRQLALAFAIMLVGGFMAGDGLMRRLPYYVIGAAQRANQTQTLADMYTTTGIRPSLFPEKIAFGQPSPISDSFYDRLPPVDPSNPNSPLQPVPWRALAGPALRWGLLFLSSWLLMLGLAQILIPQWRDHERLPFPLLQIQKDLLQPPGDGHLLPPLLRSRLFWLSVLAVFCLKTTGYVVRDWPGVLPAIPLQWDISDCFTSAPWNQLPPYMMTGFLFFSVIGIAFFMRARITLSIWVFTVAYALYQMLTATYRPPFQGGVVAEHRTGAMLALAAGVLWLGRRHFAQVAGLLARRPRDAFEQQMQRALGMMLAGCAGTFAWMLWFGLSAGWALFFVAVLLLTTLLVTRIVAETGLPCSQAALSVGSLLYLAPLSWITPLTALFNSLFADLFVWASIANPGALASHALLLDDTATPRRRWRLSLLLVGVLAVGFLVCGGVHVYGTFHQNMTMDGKESPVNPYFYNTLNWYMLGDARNVAEGVKPAVSYDRPAHLAFGAALAGGLEWASLSFPAWPLHPIGMLMLGSWYIDRMWQSIFLGWLLNRLVLRYGGNHGYRRAAPLFLGLVVGEVGTMIIWGLLPAVRTLCFS